MQKLLVCLYVGQTKAIGWEVDGRGWGGGYKISSEINCTHM